jgi:hypothetical protein
MDDEKIFQRGVVAEKKKNLSHIKEPNNGEKVKQLASHDIKFLKDGSSGHGVESNYDVHLLHHLMKLDVLNNLDTINHHLTRTPNLPHQTNEATNEQKKSHEIANIKFDSPTNIKSHLL